MRFKRLSILMSVLLASCAPGSPTSTSTPIPLSTAVSVPSPTAVPTVFVSPTPVNLPMGEEIIFEESGGKKFTGTTYGKGETAIVLANMSVGGEAQWAPFVAAVDKDKFTTITFNYRNFNDPDEDIHVVLNKLKADGFSRIVCIGASMGTRVCSTIAREPELVGIALIAGAVHHVSVAETTYPKLFVVAAQDRSAYDIQAGYEKAAQPKALVLFENNRAHGTDLFRSQDSEQFLQALLDFVNGLAHP